MKKIVHSVLALLLALTFLASCTQTTCPTYAKHEKSDSERTDGDKAVVNP